jgi:hypothetical protein
MLTLTLLSVVGPLTLSSPSLTRTSFQALPKAPASDLVPSFNTSQAFFTPPSTLPPTLVHFPCCQPSLALNPHLLASPSNVCCLISPTSTTPCTRYLGHITRHPTSLSPSHPLTLSLSTHTHHELNNNTLPGQGPIAVSRMV